MEEDISRAEVMDEIDGFDEVELIKEQIEYDALIEQHPSSQLGCIVNVVLNVLHSDRPYFIIDGARVPAAEVRRRFRKLDRTDVEYVFDALKQSSTMVKNWPNYLLVSLYNTKDTKGFFYDAWVRHDQAAG